MRLELAQLHREALSRRDALRVGAASAAVIGFGLAGTAAAAPAGTPRPSPGPHNDDMFDVDAVLAGAWAPGPYGPDDQRGTFNELNPERTAKAAPAPVTRAAGEDLPTR